MSRVTRLLVLASFLSCQRAGPPEAPQSKRAGVPGTPTAPPRDREFAVFAQRALRIEKTNVPIPAPLTVGSRASPATMVSDDPEVVAIAEDGSLVAHRPGATAVRGVGTSSVLLVEVADLRRTRASKVTVRTSRQTSKAGGRP